jgi:hypothetical protein
MNDKKENKDNDDKCSICMDDENMENLKKTPCNHSFHLECLKQLTRPKCPLCNKNIIKFLVKNGVTKNEIFKKIKNDDNRIAHDTFIGGRTLDEMDSEDIMLTAILAKNKMGDKWIKTYANILINIINHASKEFCELSLLKKNGFFIIHYDLSTLITNIIDGYTNNLISWRRYDDDYNDGLIPPHVMEVLKDNVPSLLIIIEDDIDNDTRFIKQVNIKENIIPLPSYKDTLKTICDCEYKDNTNELTIGLCEKEWIANNIKNTKDKDYSYILYQKKYKFMSDVLTNEIELLFEDNTKKCLITMVPIGQQVSSDRVPIGQQVSSDRVPIGQQVSSDRVPIGQQVSSDRVHNNDVFRYILFKKNGKFMYSSPSMRGNKIIGDSAVVSRFLHRRLKYVLPTTLRFIENSGTHRICQLVCMFDKGVILRRMSSDASRDAMNKDSETGKKLLSLNNEVYI